MLFTTVLVAIAGVLTASVLFFSVGGTQDTPSQTAPLFLGLDEQLRDKIREGSSPLYFPSPFGDDGFWLDLENREFVAYVLVLPNTRHCTVKWKDPRDNYIDCNGDAVAPSDLDQYTVVLRNRSGGEHDVLVDLRKVTPAQPV